MPPAPRRGASARTPKARPTCGARQRTAGGWNCGPCARETALKTPPQGVSAAQCCGQSWLCSGVPFVGLVGRGRGSLCKAHLDAGPSGSAIAASAIRAEYLADAYDCNLDRGPVPVPSPLAAPPSPAARPCRAFWDRNGSPRPPAPDGFTEAALLQSWWRPRNGCVCLGREAPGGFVSRPFLWKWAPGPGGLAFI